MSWFSAHYSQPHGSAHTLICLHTMLLLTQYLFRYIPEQHDLYDIFELTLSTCKLPTRLFTTEIRLIQDIDLVALHTERGRDSHCKILALEQFETHSRTAGCGIMTIL